MTFSITMLAYLSGGQDQESTTTCLNLDTHEDLLSLLQSNVSHGQFECPHMNNHLARSTYGHNIQHEQGENEQDDSRVLAQDEPAHKNPITDGAGSFIAVAQSS